MRTHKHADLADSRAALIADLNRLGDLSLSLTHTRHTSFFSFPSRHPLPQTLSSSCPNIRSRRVALHYFASHPSLPWLARHDHR